MNKNVKKSEGLVKQSGWLVVSGIAFLITLIASGILIFFGKQLANIGIIGNVYYIILIPLGFSSAAFLAGAMKSYASFTSNESFTYGKLRLTGPIVIFALVVGGGFIMPNLNKKEFFDIKFRIVGTDKPTNEFNNGKLILYVGKEPKTSNIHDGEAVFYNIPQNLNNKNVKIQPIIDNYQLLGPDEVLISKSSDYVDIKIERTKKSLETEIRGSIIDGQNAPVKNALLNFGSGLVTGYSNQNGDFLITVPVQEGEKISLKVLVNDVVKFNEDVTISSNIPINLKL